MSDNWHYEDQGKDEGQRKVVGPTSLENLQHVLASNPNWRAVLVWRTGFDGWKPAGDVSELKSGPFAPPPLSGLGQPQRSNHESTAPILVHGPVMDVLRLGFDFTGRANRAKYWLVIGVNVFINTALIQAAKVGAEPFLWILVTPVFVVSMISFLAVTSRRFHDREKSAWWILLIYLGPPALSVLGAMTGRAVSALVVAPILAIFIWAIAELGCLRGTEGPNRYGPDPLAPAPH